MVPFVTIDSEQGVKQGDGLGSLLFALSVQGVYRRVTRNVMFAVSRVR